MYCTNCGYQTEEHQRFCNHCGAAVPEHTGAQQYHEEQQYPAQAQQPFDAHRTTEITPPAEAEFTGTVEIFNTPQYNASTQVENPTILTPPEPSAAPVVPVVPVAPVVPVVPVVPAAPVAPADVYSTQVNTTAVPPGTGAVPPLNARAQLERTFSISRNNLLAVLAFTCINLVLALTQSDFFFLFSARIPLILLYIDAYEWTAGSYDFSMFGIIAAFSAVSLYAIFWGVAKKHRAWIIAALVYFSLDILLTVIFVLAAGVEFEVFSIIEIAFMAWILFYLISGTRAWSKLRKMPLQDESIQFEQGYVDPQRNTIPVVYIPPSAGIRRPSKRGQILATQKYSNMEIVVKRALKTTELIINDMVYAEKTGVHEKESYTLNANVYNVIVNVVMDIPSFITQVQSNTLPTMYLYVNGSLVATKVRHY